MRIEQGVKFFENAEGYDQNIVTAITYQGERVIHIADNVKASVKVSYNNNLSPFSFYGIKLIQP